jgi:hypothetical protein
MVHVPAVSGMTTSGPVVSLITPTSSSTEPANGQEQHR